MANRGEGGRRGIRGPQSALTDFLAVRINPALVIVRTCRSNKCRLQSNNISAAQIRATVQERIARAQAESESGQPAQAESSRDAQNRAAVEEVEEAVAATTGGSAKRKRPTKKQQASAKKKAKKDHGEDDDSDSEFDLNDVLGRKAKAKPPPGQFANCGECDKRFTVTPYTKENEFGELLCTPCGKQFAKDNKAAEANKLKRKASSAGGKRRQTESNRLDGIVGVGAPSLVDICFDRIAKHHGDVEELGDLPDFLVDRLSEIFSKRRVLSPDNLQLFLRPDLDTVALHDAAKLNESDFNQIFAVAPQCKKLVLRNCGQFKDSCVDYMIEKAKAIKFIQLYGANLVTDDGWCRLFKAYGRQLEAAKIEWCDAAFSDDALNALVKRCPNLRRLKLKYCRKITASCLSIIYKLNHLEHLTLRPSSQLAIPDLVRVLQKLGPGLKTLSFQNVADIDDSVVDVIRERCSSLSKLRLADVEFVSDAALTSLFVSADEKTTCVPPLRFVDFSGARDVDANKPEGDDEKPMGLASEGFKALMSHSGSTVRHLDIASCRHISHAAFCDVFQTGHSYPELEYINITFCSQVDTAVIRGIFQCCPKLKRVIAFGCFKIEEIVVPGGVAVIGVPRAHDDIEKVGDAGVDLDQALSFMNNLVVSSAA